jgi:hypothetical protein
MTLRTADPHMLLGAADLLLSESRKGLEGRWPSAVTVLLRQALERSLETLWRDKAPAMEQISYRVQLLSLRRYIDREMAGRVDHVWHVLSAATHQRAYDLPPAAVELANWYDVVAAFTRAVERATGAARSGLPGQQQLDLE